MAIYRNANWTRRNYDCTNVVYQSVPDGGVPIRMSGYAAENGEWVKAEAVPSNMEIVGGITTQAGRHVFYGFL